MVPVNRFVGLLQVITPFYLIFTAHEDQAVMVDASALFIFAFTYLYVTMHNALTLDGPGRFVASLLARPCAGQGGLDQVHRGVVRCQGNLHHARASADPDQYSLRVALGFAISTAVASVATFTVCLVLTKPKWSVGGRHNRTDAPPTAYPPVSPA